MAKTPITLGEQLDWIAPECTVRVWFNGSAIIEGKLNELRWSDVRPYDHYRVERILAADDGAVCIRVERTGSRINSSWGY